MQHKGSGAEGALLAEGWVPSGVEWGRTEGINQENGGARCQVHSADSAASHRRPNRRGPRWPSAVHILNLLFKVKMLNRWRPAFLQAKAVSNHLSVQSFRKVPTLRLHFSSPMARLPVRSSTSVAIAHPVDSFAIYAGLSGSSFALASGSCPSHC